MMDSGGEANMMDKHTASRMKSAGGRLSPASEKLTVFGCTKYLYIHGEMPITACELYFIMEPPPPCWVKTQLFSLICFGLALAGLIS